jgi:hypothetical protein
VDLRIEQGEHSFRLTGSGTRLTAHFQTFESMVYFARQLLPLRGLFPTALSLHVQYGGIPFSVKVF